MIYLDFLIHFVLVQYRVHAQYNYLRIKAKKCIFIVRV
jgi:hypothetical protein